MAYTIRALGDFFIINNNGEELLGMCPCCGKPFTKQAAKPMVAKLKSSALKLGYLNELEREGPFAEERQ